MIDRQEVMDFAKDFGLTPNVVEKDYALGWLLAGISQHLEVGQAWLFKGGTCLKKCFFETYRFSEDLDFTVPDAGHLDEAFLKRVFAEISAWVYERSGLEFPAETHVFDRYRNPRGRDAVEGKVGYRGPMARQASIPRIKLDLSDDERVVLAPVRREVHHPYSDRPSDGITVLAYAFEEVFAEKVRALAERLRPRDLYDVIHLHRRRDLEPDHGQIVETLKQKCEFKGIPVPTIASLRAHAGLDELRNGWQEMLAHQLPALPPFEEFWGELPQVFEWLLGSEARPGLARLEVPGREPMDSSWRTPAMASAWRRDFQIEAPLELIRFAAANHLCVELSYRDDQGRLGTRTIEPYSLRRTQAGDLLLHAVRHQDGQPRTYRVDRIQGASVSAQSFVPRFAIELTASGPISAPMTRRVPSPAPFASPPRFTVNKPKGLGGAARPKRAKPAGFGGLGSGPTYVYECSFCQKQFKRKRMEAGLNTHKTKDGWPCPGRTGFLVDTQW